MINVSEKLFLTEVPDQDSSISWYVFNEYFPTNKRGSLRTESNLYIRDCHKKVTLELSSYYYSDTGEEGTSFEEDQDKMVQKVDTLIQSLCRLREALVRAHKETKDLPKKVKEEEKKEDEQSEG